MQDQQRDGSTIPMLRYIGTKIIHAEPISKIGFLTQQGAPDAECDAAAGQEGYKVVYEDGYTSWSPKAVFEAAYRRCDAMNFGLATEAAKMGKKVARAGWNGQGMYAVIMPGYPDGVPCNAATAKTHGVPEGTLLKFRPYWQLYTAQGDIAMWAPSGSDSLANDWMIVQ